MILVEVAYARPDEQVILTVEAEPGITVEQAVEQSGVLTQFPEIDQSKAKFGIFGKLAKKDAVLHEGDRVEIYRPLIAGPKEARKKRAAEGKRSCCDLILDSSYTQLGLTFTHKLQQDNKGSSIVYQGVAGTHVLHGSIALPQ